MTASLGPAIAAHRLLGDGRASALVQPGAEVDWWCAPDLDSPPLLWSLLDPGGARSRWCDVRYVDAKGPPAGPTTRTVVRHATGRVECWDGLLHDEDGGSSLVRLVRAVDGATELCHELALGGFDRPWATWAGRHAKLEPGTSALVGGGRLVSGADDRTIRQLVEVRPGCWAALVVTIGGGSTEVDPDELAERLSRQDDEHCQLLDGARLPAHHPERARDALAVLRCCTYRPTGAVVAAPTTSLPEAPGHDRQFDYRYSWLRDASLAASVAALLGRLDVATDHLRFVEAQTGRDGSLPPALADVRGNDVPDEREVDGVQGWGGSRPVRVGNAAADQVQLDAIGMVVEAVSVYLQQGGSLDGPLWDMVTRIADRASEPAGKTNGIWELREPRHLVSADIGRWLALDRAIWISRGWRPLTRRGAWKRARAEARDRVVRALDDDGGLPESYDGDPQRADASSLMAPLFRLLDRRDPRAARLVDATVGALAVGPLLYRYEPGGDDGFTGTEGAFLPASFWVVSALAAVGRVEEATRLVDELCRRLPRLLPEEVDPVDMSGLGNVPLVWSHMELARALYLLDAARRRKRYGLAGLSLWRAARFVASRARNRRKRGAAGGRERAPS